MLYGTPELGIQIRYFHVCVSADNRSISLSDQIKDSQGLTGTGCLDLFSGDALAKSLQSTDL